MGRQPGLWQELERVLKRRSAALCSKRGDLQDAQCGWRAERSKHHFEHSNSLGCYLAKASMQVLHI